MCNLYRMTATISEVANLFGSLKNERSNLPSYDAIYPDQEAPIVRKTESGLKIDAVKWGVPGWKDGMRPITNVRNLSSNFWRRMLNDPKNRCLVPVTSFCEWTGVKGNKRKIWFSMKSEPLFAFAGLWRNTDNGPRYAFLTCVTNSIVAPIHPKAMPVILKPVAYEQWLKAEFREAIALAKPYDAHAMIINED